MGDIDNIDEMLAELESSSGDRDSYNYGNVDNIDDFLDQIEEEARSSHSFGGRTQSTSQTRQPAQSVTKATPASNPSRSAGQSVSRPAAPSQSRPQQSSAQNNSRPQQAQVSRPPAQASRPQQSSGGGGGAARGGKGADQLQADGYDIHHNKGKFYNYSGGKASDFRIKGTTSTRVDLAHAITLRALDDYGNPAKIDNFKDFIGCALSHKQTGDDLQCWIRDNGDCTYDLAFVPNRGGTVRMEIKLCGNPMFDIDIQVEDVGKSIWVAKPRLPAKPLETFTIDIETVDGSRPEGVAPFEVQTMGDVEGLKLINNGDGTYRFQCVPQHPGHITVQLTLHGQPIMDSPVTVPVGEGRQPLRVKQESSHVETIRDDRHMPVAHHQEEEYFDDGGEYAQEFDDGNDGHNGHDGYGDGDGGYDDDEYQPRDSTDVSNDDLNRLLDELGG